MSMFESIKDQIGNVKKIVFVTGAGISQESGIPTFRGKDGLWRNYDAMKLATRMLEDDMNERRYLFLITDGFSMGYHEINEEFQSAVEMS